MFFLPKQLMLRNTMNSTRYLKLKANKILIFSKIETVKTLDYGLLCYDIWIIGS